MGLFGKTQQPNPKELCTQWTHNLRKEKNNIDRQIQRIEREELKTKKLLKESAKRGETGSCRILAKEIVNAKKVVGKLHASKAHLNSVQMSMKHQLATLRIAGAMQKSTEVMQSMQQLVKVPEIQATMMEMSKEMMKAGIIEEMLDDTMESLDDDELEDEADEEVDRVLYELTAGVIGTAPDAVEDSLPSTEPEGARAGPSRGAAAAALEEDGEDDMEDMKARLEALRS